MKVEGNKCVTYIEKIYDKKQTVFNKEEKQNFNNFFFFAFGRLSQLRENIWFISNSKTKKKKNENKNSNSKKSFERKQLEKHSQDVWCFLSRRAFVRKLICSKFIIFYSVTIPK
jgi:hypothetical protein